MTSINPNVWLYAAVWLPFTLCLGFYGLRSPWRSTLVGRGLFSLYASLVVVLTLAMLILAGVIPEWLRPALRLLTLSGVCAAGWIQLATILRLQRSDRATNDKADR